MPPKRKTAPKATEELPTKRRKRTNAPLLLNNPPLSASPRKKTYHAKRDVDHSTNRDNEPRHDHESSEDELALSYSNHIPMPAAAVPSPEHPAMKHARNLHANESTPSRKHIKRIQGSVASPSSSVRRKGTSTSHPLAEGVRDGQSLSELAPSTNSRQSVTQMQRSAGSIDATMSDSFSPSKKLLHLNPVGPASRRKTCLDNSGDILSTNNTANLQKKSPLQENGIFDDSDNPSPPPSPTKRQKKAHQISPSKRALMSNVDIIPRPSALKFESVTISSPGRPGTPMKATPFLGAGIASPKKITKYIPSSPVRLPRTIPIQLHPCLNVQKRVILSALQKPIDLSDVVDNEEGEAGEATTNEIAFQQLTNLLTGSVSRGEGNSCLILGPRGSGKTGVRSSCLSFPPAKNLVP